MSKIVGEPPSSGGGGGGGAVTVADGANVTQGAKADALAASGSVSVVSLLKWLTDAVKLEDSAHVSGDKGHPILTKRTDTAATSADTTGDYATLNTDATGRLWSHVGIVDEVVPGVAATDLGKAEDAAHTTGDTGVMSLAVRRAANSDLSAGGTDGDYEPLEIDATGRLWTHVGAMDAGETHMGEVGGKLATVTVEFTRPSDTTAYAAGDVVSNSTSTTTIQDVANLARVSGGSGYIVGAMLHTDKKSITPRFRVHLFNATGATVAADNVAFKDVYADISKRIGYFDLFSMVTGTDTTNSDESRVVDMTLRVPFVAVTRSVFFVLETLDIFTPASAEKFSLTLIADVN